MRIIEVPQTSSTSLRPQERPVSPKSLGEQTQSRSLSRRQTKDMSRGTVKVDRFRRLLDRPCLRGVWAVLQDRLNCRLNCRRETRLPGSSPSPSSRPTDGETCPSDSDEVWWTEVSSLVNSTLVSFGRSWKDSPTPQRLNPKESSIPKLTNFLCGQSLTPSLCP